MPNNIQLCDFLIFLGGGGMGGFSRNSSQSEWQRQCSLRELEWQEAQSECEYALQQVERERPSSPPRHF